MYIETNEEYELFYIDASGMSTFTRCPAKYMFERILGLSQVGRSMIAPDFGTCMHRALPLAYEDLDAAIQEFNTAWQEYSYGAGDDKRNLMRASMMLRNFYNNRKKAICPYEILEFDNITEATQEKVSKYEIPFAIDIGADLIACGRIDLPIKRTSTGDIFACDYKTTQEISPRFFKCFSNSAQSLLYTVALSHITNVDVKGFAIEAVRVSARNDETQIDFLYMNEWQISWFLDYACRTVERLLECNKNKKWDKNLCSCSGYSHYGHPTSTCEYLNICKNGANWEATSKMFERTEPFHPFKLKAKE
jgi:hypothetical protein